MRRRLPPPTSLTSLLDVLFILIFAALIHTASSDASASAALQTPEGTPDAGVASDAGLDATADLLEDRSRLRELALAQIHQELASRPQIFIKVSAPAGAYLVELEHSPGAWTPLPVLEIVEDPEIGLAYAGDRDPQRGLCAQIASILGAEALEGGIVIVSTTIDPEKLPVALARGLADESNTCAREFGGMLVTLSPKDIEP